MRAWTDDERQKVNTTVTVSAITVDGTSLLSVDPELGSIFFFHGVSAGTARVTVVVTPNHSAATVSWSTLDGTTADADPDTEGQQVDLVLGSNTVYFTVTSEEGVFDREYELYIGRGVNTAFGWKAVDDLYGLRGAGNRQPRGIWSDETTIWVADEDDGKLYAYRLAGGARDEDRDFDTLDAAGNDSPQGIWSDGEIMWVADGDDDKLYAYRLSDGRRLPGPGLQHPGRRRQQQSGRYLVGSRGHVGGGRGRRQALRLPALQRDTPAAPRLRHAECGG